MRQMHEKDVREMYEELIYALDAIDLTNICPCEMAEHCKVADVIEKLSRVVIQSADAIEKLSQTVEILEKQIYGGEKNE